VAGQSHNRPAGGVAFLLAQVGGQAARRFADRVAKLDLTPAQAGILRAIASQPGCSQQALSERLSLIPSRVVAFIDGLEERGVVERRRNPADRRLHALYLTPSGEMTMSELGQIALQHEQDLLEGLTQEQRAMLTDLLVIIADREGLTPGAHPGYRAVT
jgi:DNA-binding MarR family transcriptional regulator